jgi:GTP cyclohydrolase I
VIGEEEDEEIPAGVLTRLEFIAENPKREQAQVSCTPQRFKEQREKGFAGIR